MDPLPLNPGDYTGTYKLIAGEPSLDLVNTVSWPRTAREHDWLDSAENVLLWAEAVGLISRGPSASRGQLSRSVSRDLADVRAVRSCLREVLWPIAHGTQPLSDAVKALDELVAHACAQRHLDAQTQQWRWARPVSASGLLAPIVWNAAHVLTDVDRGRIGHCPSCDWLFVDTTRNHSRRWCDMADCGSRDKALRYYHRTKP